MSAEAVRLSNLIEAGSGITAISFYPDKDGGRVLEKTDDGDGARESRDASDSHDGDRACGSQDAPYPHEEGPKVGCQQGQPE